MGYVKVSIYGTSQAAELGTKLIRAGDGALKNKLYEAIRKANIGLEGEIRRSALTHLPRRGGLAEAVASSRISIRRSFGLGNGVGITVSASHQYDLSGLDHGLDVHPLFGNKAHWYLQKVRSGWFSDATDGQREPTRVAIERAVKAYVRSL